MSILFNLVPRLPWDGQPKSPPPQLHNVAKFTKQTFFILPGSKICNITNEISTENVLEDITIIRENETFCLNSQKLYLLQNVSYFLPGLFFWMRPENGLDLAVKTTIKPEISLQ